MVGIIFPPIVEYEWTGNIIPTIIVIGGMWVKQCHGGSSFFVGLYTQFCLIFTYVHHTVRAPVLAVWNLG